jgi:hypothetical protein
MGWLRLGVPASGILLVAALGSDGPPTFSFAGFDSTSGLRLVGDARRADKALRLTRARQQTAGGAWFIEKQPLAAGFETTFQFRLTEQGGLGPGADGFAFVLQNSGPSALAGKGSAGGFALGDGQGNRNSPGIPHSIAVFFDTFHNEDGDDPSANYIAVCTNGRMGEMRWPPPRLAVANNLPVEMKDGRVHSARIVYQPPLLSVFLNDSPKAALVSTVDLSFVTDREGFAYVGFTSSTGGGYENHDILNWSFWAGPKPDVSSAMVISEISFMNAACLPNKNLCTPDRAVVERTGEGRYHIILPATMEWGASVPHPARSEVVFSNVRGSVCWDVRARGAEGCGGPGSLIMESRDGRAWFSVRDRAGAFADNEGFLEFDVEIRQTPPSPYRSVP